MAEKKLTKKEKKEEEEKKDPGLHLQVAKQMVTLATNGFGLVAALAWNNVIKDFIDNYITKYLPAGGILSLLIYALIVTVIAVLVTTNLAKTVERLEKLAEKKG